MAKETKLLKILKSSPHCSSETLKKLFDDTINNREFPDELKLADVRPLKKMIQTN